MAPKPALSEQFPLPLWKRAQEAPSLWGPWVVLYRGHSWQSLEAVGEQRDVLQGEQALV